MSAPRKRDRRIPRRPLLWLAAALLFTLPPMFGHLASWAPILFLGTLAAKFWMEPRGYRLRSIPLKLALAAVTLAAIGMSYGSLRGVEPGVSLLVVLMSLKILEAHTAREFQVMVLVAWVLCLCGFIMVQDFAIALCLFIAFGLLLAALIQFHRGTSRGGFWPPLRTAGKLTLQAIPFVALLFLLFPRVTTGFRFPTAESGSAAAGFSDRLSPGSVVSIANSPEVAFRAEFPDGKIPPRSAMYWRGAVMREGGGLEWQADSFPAAISRSARSLPAEQAIRQRITIEPHDARWLFALDWPAEPISGATLAPGNYLWSGRPIRKARQYEVRSFPAIADKELRPREHRKLLDVPVSVSPAARALAQSWARESSDPRAIVDAALRFFQTQGFRYSLSPGEYRQNGLDEFLFQRRIGFCEHYAGSFATLLRLAGVPARVVVGYLGGEFNAFGRFFLVRQADAHAWCEVWLPESGWQRVDPTSVVAPDRVNFGFETFLERRAAAGEPTAGARRTGLAGSFVDRPIFNNLRLAWDSLNYTWDTTVLSFDVEAQQSFFAALRIPDSRPWALLGRALLIAVGLLALYGGWMRWRARSRPDRVKVLHDRFCQKAARLGVARAPSEGPIDFADRAGLLLPHLAEDIRTISSTYTALRYSAASTPDLVRRLRDEVTAFGSR